MGDFIQNFEFFKKLGFDKSHHWIFYDEKFRNFFDFFANNITDANILSDEELAEYGELQRTGEYLDSDDCRQKLQQIERDNPGFLHDQESDIELQAECKSLEQDVEQYEELLDEMIKTKNSVNCRLNELEDKIGDFQKAEERLMTSCISKAKQLEGLQMDNVKLFSEATNCFTKVHSPLLFVHQMPLDQYFLKCDTFMQYFTLYMKENFKLQQDIELDYSGLETPEITNKLDKLAKTMEHYTHSYIEEKAKSRATEALIERLDMSQIHVNTLADMERETRELELVNEHHLKSTHETLLNSLNMHVQQLVQQKIELILYENTKHKLERALRRQENDQRLTKIISGTLSNAELLWMMIQLDLERVRNRFDNSEPMNAANQAAVRRIGAMKEVQELPGRTATHPMLIERMADELTQHLGGQGVRAEPKACLYEYEKFTRLLNYALQGMMNKNAYTMAMDTMNELHSIENVLKPLVYNGPIRAPMFEHVRFLRPIFEAKNKQERNSTLLRSLRMQFKENIVDRMENDKLWRYGQLLWIWFLAEPKRVLMAIEDVKKVASKVPALSGMKSVAGLKRK